MLSREYMGYSKECFNGAISMTPAFADETTYPPESACVPDLSCAATGVDCLGVPSWMEVVTTPPDQIAHGAKVDFQCTAGRKMRENDADEDCDEKVKAYLQYMLIIQAQISQLM